jgi:rhamnosyltransferase
MNFDTLGVVVTFNPNILELEKNLKQIVAQIGKLIVYDNCSSNVDEIIKVCYNNGIEIYKSNKNNGLGFAYNYILQNYASSFKYFITFDQDTFISNNCISSLLLPFYELDNVGITGPVYQKSKINQEKTYTEVEYLIQSCSVIRIDLFNIIGLFNSKLFIDSLDFDFCLRTLLAKFKIIRCNNVFINHSIGSYKKILGIKITIHNSVRNYYIARNHRFLTCKYFSDFPLFILKKNVLFLIHIFKVVILENDIKKIISLYKGIRTKV